jgi:nucleoside-diphosphate-sugar epimerase
VKALITGATGFLGRNLLEHLRTVSPEVVVHTLGRKPFAASGVTHHACDLNDTAGVSSALRSIEPTHIFHLAGNSRVSPAIAFPDYLTSNYLTTRSLAEAIARVDRAVSVFFASTVHIYGNRDGITDELAEPQPVSPYGFSKYLAELTLGDLAKRAARVRVVIGRLYSCVGPGQAEGFILSDISRRLADLKDGERLQTGTLSGFRRFLDVRDAAVLFPRLLESPTLASGDSINIAPAEQVSLREIVDSLIRISGKRAVVESAPATAPQSFHGVQIATSRLQAAVPDFQFRPLESTLRDIWTTTSNPSKA